MRKVLWIAAALVLAAWWLSRPLSLDVADVPDHDPDLANGERLFHAGGCASCHGRVEDGEVREDVLAGGLEMQTIVGRFRVPNITPHPEHGIGAWSELDFLNAMQRGVAPDGRHYYPAFPYTSYARMTREDLLDLKAWLDQLPASDDVVGAHDIAFPWSLTRGIGVWKRLYLDDRPVLPVPDDDPVLTRGRYLVEGPGHCGECHTPRNRFLGPDRSRWLGGAPDLEGEGRVPNITPGREAFAAWSEADIAYYLASGVDPEFDVVGGSMVAVQENMARLEDSDREAIAAYLKLVPPSP